MAQDAAASGTSKEVEELKLGLSAMTSQMKQLALEVQGLRSLVAEKGVTGPGSGPPAAARPTPG